MIFSIFFFDMSPYQLTLFSHTGIHFRISVKGDHKKYDLSRDFINGINSSSLTNPSLMCDSVNSGLNEYFMPDKK